MRQRKQRIQYIAPPPRVRKKVEAEPPVVQEALYRVTVYTGIVPGAGTDANVSVVIANIGGEVVDKALYKVTVYTGIVPEAGTDANVSVVIADSGGGGGGGGEVGDKALFKVNVFTGIVPGAGTDADVSVVIADIGGEVAVVVVRWWTRLYSKLLCIQELYQGLALMLT